MPLDTTTVRHDPAAPVEASPAAAPLPAVSPREMVVEQLRAWGVNDSSGRYADIIMDVTRGNPTRFLKELDGIHSAATGNQALQVQLAISNAKASAGTPHGIEESRPQRVGMRSYPSAA